MTRVYYSIEKKINKTNQNVNDSGVSVEIIPTKIALRDTIKTVNERRMGL